MLQQRMNIWSTPVSLGTSCLGRFGYAYSFDGMMAIGEGYSFAGRRSAFQRTLIKTDSGGL